MYFPYLRGRQNELLALRELVENDLLSKEIIPVIEPVKLSSTLISTMKMFESKGRAVAVIRNPVVGSFTTQWNSTFEGTKESVYKKEFTALCDASNAGKIINSMIMRGNAVRLIEYLHEKGIEKSDVLVIHTNRDYLDDYEYLFSQSPPRFVFVPDEGAYRRRVHNHKVLLDDKFPKRDRNVDYPAEDFFSDDHLYCKEYGFEEGFSDFSIVGEDYREDGFAPYAVAIHIVYFDEKQALRVKHFVSKSNDDIFNPALKYFEAVSKMAEWYESHPVKKTKGLEMFLDQYQRQAYPGLGPIKKQSIMHHLELMGRYLDGEKI
ncbi:MAG: sce7725 family protein [Clostridia bacterium]|nr:sce7725 family protein [Clostridia bacterium]